MENWLRFQEGASALSVETILLTLLATFVLSQVVGWVYVWTHRGISYSGTLSQSIVILALIVALVMLVVGNNVARAFGLFGALALIRFRTPVKDAKDTVFLFLAVAMGIATGTGNILAAVIGTLVICAILSYLSIIRFGSKLSHDGLFRFRAPAGGDHEALIIRILRRYCDSFKLLHMRQADPGSGMEFSFQVTLFDSRFSSKLVAEIEGIEGVSHLSLLMQDGEVQP
ncbi:MAG: DUF4956 domain-containing protein [Planctomycetota bacterium]